MKVLLINPPKISAITERVSYVHEPHHGLAYIASYIKRHGIDVSILDAQAEQLSVRELTARIAAEGPDVVGITAPTFLIKSAHETARISKALSRDTLTVIGGYHATALPEQTLREFPSFDLLVHGEGEAPFLELLSAVADRRDLGEVKGIAYRDSGHIRVNPQAVPIMDLDTLPFPSWELFKLDMYHPHYSFKKGFLELPISTSRGCVSKCTTCARVTGTRVRQRSVPSVIGEMQEMVDRFNAKRFVFMDETFTINIRRTHELCDAMVQSGLSKRIEWLCQTRVDRVDPDLLKKMRRAGCFLIAYGIESGNQDILDRMKKGTRLDDAVNAVRWAKQAGMTVDTFFILGLPYETRDTIGHTIRFAVRLDPDYANFFITVPYPGTEVYSMAGKGEGGLRFLTDDWETYGWQMGGSAELGQVPRKQLEALQLKAYLRFYLRPRKLKSMLNIVNIRVVPEYFYNLLRKRLSAGEARMDGSTA
ncbi:MAG: B12-binding domain-containing radical SAM protein [Deltaproteobacteria bacterium]|nr:B12-binding domain-containing radical SAM protein [Deltaproteobacteria bacterium]